MYKLILVDDEEDVREGVVREVNWDAIGFEVIEKAENGREALEMVERLQPDVVVTDIQMPFMNGLQLAEAIRERFPTIKLIILTGHDEFEYAQRAIKLHIDEYVLKPFSAQELINALLKVKGQIQEEVAHRENVQLLMEHYRKSMPVLKENFLATLMNRKLPREEVYQKAANYGIELNGRSFVAAVMSIDGALIPEEELENREELSKSVSLKYSADQALKYFALLNITEEIVDKRRLGLVFMHHDQVVVLAARESEDRETALQETMKVLEEVRQNVEKYLKFTLTVGIGTVMKDVTKISYSYEDAVLALDYRLILGNNRIISIDDVETRSVEKVRFDDVKEHALTRCIKVGTNQEIRETMDELFQGIEGAVSVKDYQIYLLEILTCILKAAKDSNLNVDEVFGDNFVPFTEINKFTSLEEAKHWLAELCASMMNHIATDRQYTYKNLVEMAKDYTKNHYHEGDITINKVCSHLHISAGYFSSIFKKETKMTFVNYLNHIRMEAAKELLRTTDMKALEIAEKVGYADANYFSFSFRKNVGVSPKEYRNNSVKGQ
ncbi:response regulator [Paenibacillus aceris]|uniref:Two-component system response regulator YesN n=1 Tax=Paenibacillus aceris TaxID=869555 RepID=A0ABS4I8T5_9BACL|nr:response regulator [Paenibacillus aceris]MBP1967318.1 two-component system response regulator YesN [Paenibacillus aceris]NHW38045.1 response regulator [Paenibacillus aceris]